MAILDDTLEILDRTLSLQGRGRKFDRGTRLLGSLPELDSMAVVGVITDIEQQFGIVIGDDEISADTFQTVGSLVDLIEQKMTSSAV